MVWQRRIDHCHDVAVASHVRRDVESLLHGIGVVIMSKRQVRRRAYLAFVDIHFAVTRRGNGELCLTWHALRDDCLTEEDARKAVCLSREYPGVLKSEAMAKAWLKTNKKRRFKTETHRTIMFFFLVSYSILNLPSYICRVRIVPVVLFVFFSS